MRAGGLCGRGRADIRAAKRDKPQSELVISARTVESHVSSVLRKLQFTSSRELSRWASTRELT